MKVIARLAGLACITLLVAACASLPLRAGQLETATKLRGHYILVHEDGHPIEAAGTFGSMRRRALARGAYQGDILDAAILRGLDEAARESRAAGRPLRILVFVHGGLNGYRQAFDRMTQLMLPSNGEAGQRGLLAQTTYYPIFINWNASLGDSITDDLFFIRFGRRVPLAAFPTAPFVLLSRMAATIFGAPIAWSNTVQNYWDGFDGPPAEEDHFLTDTLDSAAWLLPRLVTTPVLDAFGGPAWQIMKRRAQLATANRLPGNDHATEGAARTLVKQLQDRTDDEGGVPVWRFTNHGRVDGPTLPTCREAGLSQLRSDRPPAVPRDLRWLAPEREASMWVSWVVARQLVVGLVVVALAFVGLAVSLFLLTALFLD